MSDEALPTFFAEADELSGEIESALLLYESGVLNPGVVASLFRAIHTLKGSAGLFGFERVVSFTHVVETVLDRVRSGTVALDDELIANLLECHDHIELLLADAGRGDTDPRMRDDDGERLLARLRSLGGGEAECKVAAAPAPCGRLDALPTPAGERSAADSWHISLRLMPEMLRNGMDPLAILSFLRTFGSVCAIEVLDEALPLPACFEPEFCYIGFEFSFSTTADRQRIEDAFEYVREDCVLTLIPPRSSIADYVRLIKELPECETHLGQILVRCGSLTQHELDVALQLQSQAAATGSARTLGEMLVASNIVAPAVVAAAVEKQQEVAEAKARERATIRVDAQKLEQLIDVVGELAIAGAAAGLLAQRAKDTGLNEAAARLMRLVDEVRDRTLKLRMTHIGGTFGRFTRLVRDASRETGKDIRLEIDGADTELDKTLVEKIADPLTHLVRNAIDHGIEPAAVRTAAGKSPQGLIKLNAYHDSGAVVVEVSDDGGGLNRQRILDKAVERGLVAARQQLSDQQVHALIFEAGFSTAGAVTSLSGRGVGMDVVKRNVTELRGAIEIDSIEGAGTTIRIRLPLTLAIVEGFLVKVGPSAFIMPLESVEECIDAGHADMLLEGGSRCVNLRGQPLPVVRLREFFGNACRPTRRESIVVVRYGRQRAGFVVDELLGEHQAVIRPLSRVLTQVPGLSGTSILADGAIALILDVACLAEQCRLHAHGGLPFRPVPHPESRSNH